MVEKKAFIKELSIIIVNYNGGELLLNCINSLTKYLPFGFEVIVFDNNSSDNSADKLEQQFADESFLTLIRSDVNYGFARANNLAAEKAEGSYLHFLNPDVLINSQMAEDYDMIINGNKKGIFVTGLIDNEGRVQKMQHLIPTLGNYFKALFCSGKAALWNIGASVIMDTLTFKDLGGWAEDYFMYAEDLDLFYLAHKKKIPITYIDSTITHIGKGSSETVWSGLERATLIERSTRKFYTKYKMGWQYYIIRPIQLIYILINEPKNFGITVKAILNSFS